MKQHEIFEKLDFQFDSPYDRSQIVRVYKNPNYLEMSSIKNKTNYNELRGLLVGNISVYIWDANLATHGDVIALLDEYKDFNSFIIDQDSNLLAADPNTDIHTLYTIPMIKRMLNIQ